MPKVSVIVPVYGVEKYIERCAESLFGQTLDDIEYIFVDDCTLDRSIDVVHDVLERYPYRKDQAVFYKMPKNSGLPSARKAGISKAKGEYIAHCDSDDWLDQQIYEKMYLVGVQNNSDIVYCDYFKSDGMKHTYMAQKENGNLMLGPIWNKIVKAELYSRPLTYPTENKGEDGALMMQLSYYSKRRSHVKEALYYYFSNPQSICRTPTLEAILERHRQECANLDLRLRFLTERGALKQYEDDICVWKYASRRNLLPILGEKKYLEMWSDTYPEIDSQMLSNKKMPFLSKILFVAIKCGAYSLIRKLF